jgi:amino-acid N-acetyltransferase
MVNVTINNSEKKYLGTVKEILKNSVLPFEDIDEHFEHFLLAELTNDIIGIIGLEQYSKSALLRSFAVAVRYQHRGIGKKLLENLLESAKQKGIETIYLLTTTAQTYFERNGFKIIERNSLPEEIQNTKEFKSLCPVSAICMYRLIN